MRISDWSSDVCSSDLNAIVYAAVARKKPAGILDACPALQQGLEQVADDRQGCEENGNERGHPPGPPLHQRIAKAAWPICAEQDPGRRGQYPDRKSTRLNSSH